MTASGKANIRDGLAGRHSASRAREPVSSRLTRKETWAGDCAGSS
jgi:hypothetical protein